MNKPLPPIGESPESLHARVRGETDPKKRSRLHALSLLASGQVRSRLALAKLLAVHRHTIQTWLKLYEEGGLRMLLTIKKPPGKRSSLTPLIHAAVNSASFFFRGLWINDNTLWRIVWK